jgi:hypothetical protein
MFHNFIIDILLNTKYNSISVKYNISLHFKTLILEEMDYTILWYWDPTASANHIKSFINTLYQNKYSKKNLNTMFRFTLNCSVLYLSSVRTA